MEGYCSSFRAYTYSPIFYSWFLFPYLILCLLQNLIQYFLFWGVSFWWLYLGFRDCLQSISRDCGSRFRIPLLIGSMGSLWYWIYKNSRGFYLYPRGIMIYAHIYYRLFSSILSLNPLAILLFLDNLGHPGPLGQQAL